MGRKKEHAGLMKRRDAERKSGGSYCQTRVLARRNLRISVVLCFALITLAGFAPRTLGQQLPVVPPTVTIEVDKPLAEALQLRFPGKEPKSETPLEFKGNGDWTFVQFDKLPANTSLRTKDKPDGYNDSEELRPDKWYWFKNRLPLVLEIRSGAQSPVTVSFRFGSPGDNEKKAARVLRADQMRQFTESQVINRDPLTQSLALSWDASASAAAPPAQSPLSDQSANPVPTPTWTEYLLDENPLVGAVVIILILAAIGLFALIVKTVIWQVRYGSKRRRKSSDNQFQDQSQNKQKAKQSVKTIKPSAVAEDMYAGLGNNAVKKAEPETTSAAQAVDELPNSSLSPAEQYGEGDGTLPGGQQLTQVLPPPVGHVSHPPPKSPAPIGTPSVAQESYRGTQDSYRLEQLERTLGSLRMDLDQKTGHQDHSRLSDAVNALKRDYAQMDTELRQQLAAKAKGMEDFVLQQTSAMETKMQTKQSQLDQRMNQIAVDGEKVNRQLADVLTELRQVEARLKTQLAELQTTLDRRTVPDSFYARALGAVLGQHIEALRDGNFEKLMGEELNQFFQTGVARVEGLQELRARTERISGALKEVLVQMAKLNPQATDEARPQMQRVEALVNELIGLYAQLQTRRGTIETTMHIPVSMHAGARQTFLDELGRGIRREIDKLKEPENYFESELSRLITTDVISIVDICDKKISSAPGTRPELEGALKKLFEEAGLNSILPGQREPFKTAEQDLIEMDQSGGGQSLTVAQVVTRGFYYTHRDTKTLLRKAGVRVYR